MLLIVTVVLTYLKKQGVLLCNIALPTVNVPHAKVSLLDASVVDWKVMLLNATAVVMENSLRTRLVSPVKLTAKSARDQKPWTVKFQPLDTPFCKIQRPVELEFSNVLIQQSPKLPTVINALLIQRPKSSFVLVAQSTNI